MSRPSFRAVVLAAGLGTRLRPLTLTLPKPLLPVVGQPAIRHTLAALGKAGCESVAINLFHQGEKIAGRLGNRSNGMSIVYSPERELLGTLGALAPLSDFLSLAEVVVVINGDSLCRWPLKRILRAHRRSSAEATLLLSGRASRASFGGGVGLDESGAVVSFAPDHQYGKVERRVVFAGLHVLNTRLVRGLPVQRADFVTELYLPLLAAGRRIEAFETSKPWFDLGTPASYLEAVCSWAQRRGPARVAGRNWLAPDAKVDSGASLSRTVVEAGARVARGAEIVHSVVLPAARVGDGSRVRDSVIGFRVRLPAGTVVERRLVTEARADSPPQVGDSVVGGLVYSPLA